MRNEIIKIKERKNDFTTVDKVFFVSNFGAGKFKKPTITKSKVEKIGKGNPIGLKVEDWKAYGTELVHTSCTWLFKDLEDGYRRGW